MKILVVDICQGMIDRLKEILSETENISTVYGAVSYDEALHSFKNNKPQIILLNISSARNKCFTLLNEIKKTGLLPSVIALSFHTDDELKKKCHFFSVDFLLDKYHEFEKIPSIVNKIHSQRTVAKCL